MYIRLSALLPIAALAAVAAAAPPNGPGLGPGYGGGFSQCNDMGPPMCCDSIYTHSDLSLSSLLGDIGEVLPDVEGLVGLGCTSMMGWGPGHSPRDAPCGQQPVCCNGNTYNGLINIGCSPITL